MFRSFPKPMWDLITHLLQGPASSFALVPFSHRFGTLTKSTPLRGIASLLAHHLMFTHLRGSASLLAHRPVSGSNIICNSLSPPLVDIVLFELSLSSFPSRFKARLLGRGFHTLIYKGCFSLPHGISQFTPFKA